MNVMEEEYADLKPGCRVRIWDGNGKNYLGEATYVGDAKVYFMLMPDGSLRSLEDAEVEPLPEMISPDAELISLDNNPKFRMDDGTFVYGCQTWWHLA